jgi:type I restriction enzyme R subunit
MLEKYEICLGMFHGFDFSTWKTGSAAEKLSILPSAQDHILGFRMARIALSPQSPSSPSLCPLCSAAEAIAVRDEIAFFQAVRGALVKNAPGERKDR